MPGLIRLAWRFGWVSQPRDNRWHRRPTALMGGLPMAAGVAVAWGSTGGDPALALAALLMLVVGVIDDRFYELFPAHKLQGQVLAAGLLAAAGWVPAGIPQPFGALIAVVWLVGLSNALNLLDNMDGLAGGVATVAALGIASLAFFGGDAATGGLALGLAGACSAFLLFNFRFTDRPARVFMGDCGSLPLGLVLGALALRVTHVPSAPSVPSDEITGLAWLPGLLVMAVPILDTSLVTWCRWRGNRALLPGAADHISHRLVRLGLSDREAVLLHYGLASAWAGVALLASTGSESVMLSMGGLTLFTGIAAVALAAVPMYAPAPAARLHTADLQTKPGQRRRRSRAGHPAKEGNARALPVAEHTYESAPSR